MKAQLGGDESLFAEAISIFLEDCPMRLAQIRSALDLGDARAIRMSAHALRGVAGILTAHELFEAAHTIEQLGDQDQIEAARAAWGPLTDAAQLVIDTLKRFEAEAL